MERNQYDKDSVQPPTDDHEMEKALWSMETLSDGPRHLGTTYGAGVYPIRTQISNLCLVRSTPLVFPTGGVTSTTTGTNQDNVSGDGAFVIVDAGMPHFASRIIRAAADKFGADAKPSAIILTHGHFDHVGSLTLLLEQWNVPVYAHELELPYLTGEQDYPPADPNAGGGIMSVLSPLYPREAMQLGVAVHPLPEDGRVPGLPDWKWLHTPGHTPGHVSLFRHLDGALIAGDAFTTVEQESLLAVITQHVEVHGPPAYFTIDWRQAADSVRRLERLQSHWAITGHGQAMSGVPLRDGLERLAEHFETIAVPEHFRHLH